MTQPNSPPSSGNSAATKPSTADETKKRIDELQNYISLQIQIYLTQWQLEAESAASSAIDATSLESKYAFAIALVGNLFWAATAFLDPTKAAITVRIMSQSGAAVGSGTVTQFSEKPPSAVDMVKDRLAEARGDYEEYYLKQSRDWAIDLDRRFPGAGSGIAINDKDSYIWYKMFSDVKFDNTKYLNLRSRFKQVIASSIADFERQWRWNDWHKLDVLDAQRRGIDLSPQVRFWWNGRLLGPPIKNYFGNMCLEVSGTGQIRVYDPLLKTGT